MAVSILLCLFSGWQDRRQFLQLASTGCSRFDLNRSAWALESEITQIGGLIYW
jgi:hypothetical protein